MDKEDLIKRLQKKQRAGEVEIMILGRHGYTRKIRKKMGVHQYLGKKGKPVIRLICYTSLRDEITNLNEGKRGNIPRPIGP